MKSRQKNTKWRFRIFLLLVLLGFTSFTVLPANSSETILFSGNWPIHQRSLAQIPISASICNSVIFIQNSSPDRDITVHIISEKGIIVYDQEITRSETASVIINVDDLVKGEYVLQLSDSAGGLLWGKFVYE